MQNPKIHPTAVIAKGAHLAKDVEVGPYAVIHDHVHIAEGVKIHSHVVIHPHTEIGAFTEIFSFSIIGGIPQLIHLPDAKATTKIGSHNIIREHVTIHGGANEGTIVGNKCMIMVSAHIAHDCHLGNGVLLVNQSTLGGHVVVGDHAYIGGLSGIHQKVRLGHGCIIGGLSGVEGDVIPYGSVVGNRARLCGLNLVGLKRRGESRERIHALRSAYRLLFAAEGTMSERLEDAEERFKDHPIVMEVLSFIRETGKQNKRSLCLPN